jgi:tetratricopeptide (TPR) repeat protein
MRCIRSAAIARACLAPVFCALVLALVASAPAFAAKPKHYEKLFNAAEAHVAAGRVEPALVAFGDAARADPTRKEPWVRSAQLLFDAGRYGRAIVAAEEVLQRDPQDRVADSVLTIAGMRLAGQSLQRLQASGALSVSETARKEAQQLAGAVRETLIKAGPEAGAPRDTRPKPKPKRSKAVARAAATAGEPAAPAAPVRAAEVAPRTSPKPAGGGANPFDVLNR